jgi:outer membrane protein
MKRKFLMVLLFAIGVQTQAQTIYTLSDCRRMSSLNNKELLIAGEKVKAANSLVKAAKTQYLPNFSANGGYLWNEKNMSLLGEDTYLPVYAMTSTGKTDYANSWSNSWTMVNGSAVPLDADNKPFNPKTNPEKIQWKNQAFIPKDAFTFDTHNVYVGSIMMTQPLFMGNKIREINNIAKSSKKIAEARLEGEKSETIINTDIAYWRIVSLINKQKLAKSYVGLLQKVDSDIEKSIQFGVATKSDGLTVKVKLNEAEMSLLQVEDGLTLSRMALSQLCGLPLNSEFRLADEDIQQMPITTTEILNQATSLENRYEIKSLKQAVNIAESNQKIMVSRFMPNVGLTAGYLVSNPNMYNGYQQNFSGEWQIGVVANVPLFHWGERIHTLNAAKNEKVIAQYKLDDAKEKVELDITQAGFKTKEADKKAKMTGNNKVKAEENLRYATVGFESGVITASALLEAQTAWLKANSDDIDAKIDVQLCSVYLQKALGNLK